MTEKFKVDGNFSSGLRLIATGLEINGPSFLIKADSAYYFFKAFDKFTIENEDGKLLTYIRKEEE